VTHTPVLIIGGGPAGSAAASTLAQAGVGCLVLDKSDFPRDKLCGGLVTGRCMTLLHDVFGLAYDEEILNQSSDIKLMMRSETLSRVTDHSTLFFTMRQKFDNWLLERAKSYGAKLKTGVGVDQIKPNSVILSDGSEINFDILIGCDGVNSMVARHLFGRSFDPKTIGFGLEAEVPISDKKHHVEIDFGAVNWGYGWAFPKQKTVTIGVGGIHTENPKLKDQMQSYLLGQGIDPATCKIKGQYIPFGDYREISGHNNIVLCGDAAGFVDPITGEGIGYAIQSGAQAAQAAINALAMKQPEQVYDLYYRATAPIRSDLKRAKAWRYVIFAKPLRPVFKRFFGRTGTLSRGYLDIMSGTRDYTDLPRLLLKRIFRL
jgi:geranylgeranyl reductase family protein